MILIRNSGKCRKCNYEVVSKHVHDYQSCVCGAVAVDGGRSYLRRTGNTEDFEDTSLNAVIVGKIRHEGDYKDALEGVTLLTKYIQEYERDHIVK